MIDLLSYQKDLQVTTHDGKRYIYDPIRKKRLVLGPEEIVRQLCVQYLLQEKKVNANRINVEKQLIINGLKRRFDIIVYDMAMQPFLLVECKAPNIPIEQKTFDQIGQYNLALKTPYLWVSNGQTNYCCQIDFEKGNFRFLDAIPAFPKP